MPRACHIQYPNAVLLHERGDQRGRAPGLNLLCVNKLVGLAPFDAKPKRLLGSALNSPKIEDHRCVAFKHIAPRPLPVATLFYLKDGVMIWDLAIFGSAPGRTPPAAGETTSDSRIQSTPINARLPP